MIEVAAVQAPGRAPAFQPFWGEQPRAEEVRAAPMYGSAMVVAARQSGAGLPDPLAILTTLEWWYRSDQLTQGSGVVSSWTDLSGNGRHLTEATNRPAYNATGGPNGGPCVTGDGVNDVLSVAWTRASPGTQPFYTWLICKAHTWTNNDCLMGDGATNFAILQRTTTPSVTAKCATQVGGSLINGAPTLGSYFRYETQNGNSGADYLKIGGTTITGLMGNTAGGGTLQLFASGSTSLFANVSIVEAFCYLGVPTSGQRSQLDAYCDGRNGGGLT